MAKIKNAIFLRRSKKPLAEHVKTEPQKLVHPTRAEQPKAEHAGTHRPSSARPTQTRPESTRRDSYSSRPPRQESGSRRRSVEPRHDREGGAAPVSASRAIPWSLDEYAVAPEEGKVRFHDLDLPIEVMQAVSDLKFQYCTSVQALIMPKTLQGLDAAGKAQTGTGKTAAFLLTMLARFLRNPIENRKHGTPRALILAPTRELVIQIQKDAEALSRHCPVRCLAVYGGMDLQKQRRMLQETRTDIVAATPGRLLDFKSTGAIDLSAVEVLVIDEADRMLDMGFIPDVKRIVYSLPPKERRQTLLFSATLTKDILMLASRWMRDPEFVEVESEKMTVDAIDQKVYTVAAREKFPVLYHLLKSGMAPRVLVFRNRRDGVERLAMRLGHYGIACAQLSGDVPQQKRLSILEAFRTGQVNVVVATDVAGRGIHVDGISHVVNYDVPIEADDYVHRIGRTGRAGATGTSITFACEEGAFNLPAIEKYIGRSLTCEFPDEAWLKMPVPAAKPALVLGVAPGGTHPGSGGRSGSSSDGARPRPGGRSGGYGGGRPPPRRSGPPRRR